MYENTQYGGVRLIPTAARHGTKISCGPACGVLFRTPGEKTLYVAGDTIFYDEVAAVLEKYHPEVIILNACGATLKYFGRLIMDAHDDWLFIRLHRMQRSLSVTWITLRTQR